MDKEKVITILIGLGIGILCALGYFLLTSLPKTLPKPSLKIEEKIPEKQKVYDLVVNSPQDYLSTTSANFEIAGQTTPGAKVLIISNADEKIASSDASGSFSQIIKLEDGDNIISVSTIFDPPKNIIRHLIFEVNSL